MLSLTRRVSEEIQFSDSYGPIAALVITEVKENQETPSDATVAFTFTPTGEEPVRHKVKFKGDVELCNGAGVMGRVRVTSILGDDRARLAFDFPKEIRLK